MKTFLIKSNGKVTNVRKQMMIIIKKYVYVNYNNINSNALINFF